MLDVMFYEVFKEEEAALRKFLSKNIKAEFTSKTIQDMAEKNVSAPVISIRTQSRIPPAWAAQGLKGVLTRSSGYDHLIEYQKKINSKIICGYLGDYCSRAVAEQSILMMMALLRRLKRQIKNFNRFNRDEITGSECQGRRLLVVGVGNIGREIVDLGRGLRMKVKGVDIQKTVKGLDYVALTQGVAWADVIICTLPLTEKTRGMLNYSQLKKAPAGFIFVNISRGEVSPIADLAKLLKIGACAGFGFDVFEKEAELAVSLRNNKKSVDPAVNAALSLRTCENVVFTPHNAFNTAESVERKSRLSAESVRCFLSRKKFPFPVPHKHL